MRTITCTNRTIITVGSNADNAAENIKKGIDIMQTQYVSSRFSSIYSTKAVGALSDCIYRNCVGILNTTDDFETVNKKLKEIEISLGRNAQSKQSGIIPMDIDIVMWNGEVIRPDDVKQPYFLIGYIELNEMN